MADLDKKLDDRTKQLEDKYADAEARQDRGRMRAVKAAQVTQEQRVAGQSSGNNNWNPPPGATTTDTPTDTDNPDDAE